MVTLKNLAGSDQTIFHASIIIYVVLFIILLWYLMKKILSNDLDSNKSIKKKSLNK